MKKNKIRPLAICVFWRDGRLLAARGYDKVRKQVFYRPLGGAIEFGESGAETIHRELEEEIDAKVKDVRYLATLENIFTFNGDNGHEIVLIYDGAFTNKSFYKRDSIEGHEDNTDARLFTAYWMKLKDFRGKHAPPLYPTGLLELLEREFSKT